MRYRVNFWCYGGRLVMELNRGFPFVEFQPVEMSEAAL